MPNERCERKLAHISAGKLNARRRVHHINIGRKKEDVIKTPYVQFVLFASFCLNRLECKREEKKKNVRQLNPNKRWKEIVIKYLKKHTYGNDFISLLSKAIAIVTIVCGR